MTVSTSFSREFQVSDIVRRAYQYAGLKPAIQRLGAGITADEVAMAQDFLELRLDELQTKSTAVRFRGWKTIPLVAGTQSYTPSGANADVIDIEGAAETYSAATDVKVPCLPIHNEEFFANPSHDVTTGRPVNYTVVRNALPPTLYVWPIPDAAYTLRYRGVRSMRDVDLSSATVDLEPFWSRWLILALAADLAEHSNKPTEHVARLESKAQAAETSARNYSRPHGPMRIRLEHRGPWR